MLLKTEKIEVTIVRCGGCGTMGREEAMIHSRTGLCKCGSNEVTEGTQVPLGIHGGTKKWKKFSRLTKEAEAQAA